MQLRDTDRLFSQLICLEFYVLLTDSLLVSPLSPCVQNILLAMPATSQNLSDTYAIRMLDVIDNNLKRHLSVLYASHGSILPVMAIGFDARRGNNYNCWLVAMYLQFPNFLYKLSS